MEKVDHIICGDYVLPMDGKQDVIEHGAMAVKDGMISAVGPCEEISRTFEAKSTINGDGKAVLPGLINTHTHAAMVFMRGMADDLPLMEWLERHIWPVENRWLGPDFVGDALELACLEMLKAGVTTFNDMYFFEGVAARTARRIGIRAVLGAGVIDIPTKTTSGADDCLQKAERCTPCHVYLQPRHF
jgi:5-methylthioadenosine/S-adenosylhomocysteine deaminase